MLYLSLIPFKLVSRGSDSTNLQIEVEVIDSLDKHPVAKMDRGELIPLPNINKDFSDLPTYNPSIEELRDMYQFHRANGDFDKMQEIGTLGRDLSELYPYPWSPPDGYRNEAISIFKTEIIPG